MIVNHHEGYATIVFEDGLVYDCFVEWILSGENEKYVLNYGKIISVDWSSHEVVEYLFEDAIPVMGEGSELDAITGESHSMMRLELKAVVGQP